MASPFKYSVFVSTLGRKNQEGVWEEVQEKVQEEVQEKKDSFPTKFLEFTEGHWNRYFCWHLSRFRVQLMSQPTRIVIFSEEDLEKFPNCPKPAETHLGWLKCEDD